MLAALKLLRDNIFAVVLAVIGIFAVSQKLRADRKENEVDELRRDVAEAEISREAARVRSQPVPRDKSDILGRM